MVEDFVGNLELQEVHTQNTIVARRVSSLLQLNARDPAPEWLAAKPILFASDWQGKNLDPSLETEVKMLWSPETLYLRFVCRYRDLFIFSESGPDGRRDRLWDRDVAEAFLQPAELQGKPSSPQRGTQASGRFYAFYKEFEIAPNGMWIDIDISPSGPAALNSGLARSVHVDAINKIWAAELAIPLKAVTANFHPGSPWRANFFRVEGNREPRSYMAWQPTHTPQPNFHIPRAFGVLKFEP
jgi:alpha-galactosidase